MIAELQEIGLSKREATVYLALLELGSSKVGSIIKKTHIPSSKIYDILHLLSERGFVSFVIQNNVRQYQAADPKTIIAYVSEKKKKLEEILPSLLLKQKFTEKKNVSLYSGQKAVFTLFTSLLNDAKPKEEYFVFSIGEEQKSESATLFFKNLAVRRKDKKIITYILKNIHECKKEYKKNKKEKHTKVQLRFTVFNLPQGITIFRNHLILLSWGNSPLAIHIENEQFAKEFRDFFRELWEKGKE